MASAHLAHLWSPVRRVSYRSHQDAPDFSAMHPSCCCSPPPTLGPDAAYSYAVGAVKPPEHRRHRASGWPSGPRTPRRRPHDSMSCSRRGAHRPPPVTAQRVAELSTSAAGGVGAPAASPGRFGSKACCSAADRIADSPGFFFLSVRCPVGWWCAAQAFHLIRQGCSRDCARTGEARGGPGTRGAARRAHGPGRTARAAVTTRSRRPMCARRDCRDSDADAIHTGTAKPRLATAPPSARPHRAPAAAFASSFYGLPHTTRVAPSRLPCMHHRLARAGHSIHYSPFPLGLLYPWSPKLGSFSVGRRPLAPSTRFSGPPGTCQDVKS